MMTSRKVIRRGRRVYLGERMLSDAQTIINWINNPAINQYLATSGGLTLRQERIYLRKAMKDKSNRVLMICDNETDQVIGTMGIHRIDHAHGTASTGAIIDPVWQGKGVGHEAKELLLSYAFRTLRLRKITSAVFPHNERSRRYLLNSGYREEGYRVAQIRKGDVFIDEVLLAIFRAEWESRQ